MKKMTALGAVLAALLSIGAFTASAAFANEGLWAINKVALTKAWTPTWKSSAIEFQIDHNGEFKMTCEPKLKGTVTTEGRGEITSILSGKGAAAIPCYVAQQGSECATGAEGATIEALNLPWKTKLNKTEEILFEQPSGKLPEWKIKCKGQSGFNRCKAAASALALPGVDLGYGAGEVAIDYPGSKLTECSNDSGGVFRTTGVEIMTSGKTGSLLEVL